MLIKILADDDQDMGVQGELARANLPEHREDRSISR